VRDWRELLTRQVVEGRQLLPILNAPILFTPWERDAGWGYRFEGVASIASLFSGIVEVIGVASPPGFEPGFQP
jgi:hypothetical protein